VTAPPTALLRRAATNRIASMLRAGTIPDVGQFGTGGSLPTGAGPVDPPILTGGPGGNYTGPNAGGDYWTRIDPGMGYIDPTLTVYPANPADANTTQPPPVPNSEWRDNAGHSAPPPQPVAPTVNQSPRPSVPLWFQPGYQPPAGIQAAIDRGDYSSAYGQSSESRLANFIADSQRFAGEPNHMPVSDAGRDTFYNLGRLGGVRGQVDPEGGIRPVPVNQNGLPNPITAFLQRLRGGNTERASSGMLR
jgi:hypothetical protein